MPALLASQPSTGSKRSTDIPRYMIQTESWSRHEDEIVNHDGLFPWKSMEFEPPLQTLHLGESTLCTHAFRIVRPLEVVRITRVF